MRVGKKKRTLRSNQETDEGKRCTALANSLTKKAPYKGLGADSEEKREPVSDIDTEVVDSLKVLDPKRPIREADIASRGTLFLEQRHREGDRRPLSGTPPLAPRSDDRPIAKPPIGGAPKVTSELLLAFRLPGNQLKRPPPYNRSRSPRQVAI